MRKVAEAFHPSVFIIEEMEARGWSRDILALKMCKDSTAREFGLNRLALDFYLDIGPEEPRILIGDGEDFARAFDVSAEMFVNLEKCWLENLPKSESTHDR